MVPPLLVAFGVAWGALDHRIGYDEAYNLQVATNIGRGWGYSTDFSVWGLAGTPYPFDPMISTGPLLLLPVAGVTALGGPSLLAIRIVPFAIYLILILVVMLVARRAGCGTKTASLVGLAACSVSWRADLPEGMVGPADVLGEGLALLLLLVSIIALDDRRWWWSALFAGLAVMTKVLVLLTFPALLIAWMAAGDRLKWSWAKLVGWSAIAAAPTGLWWICQWLILGRAEAGERALAYIRIVVGGSGLPVLVGELEPRAPLLTLIDVWAWKPLPGILLLSSICAGVILLRARRRLAFLEIALIGAGLTVVVWWFTLASGGYSRHLILGSFLLTIGASVLTARGFRTKWRASKGAAAMTVAGIAAITLAASSWTAVAKSREDPGGPSLVEQRAVAEAVERSGANSILGRKWWMAAEIGWLSRIPMRPLHAESHGTAVLLRWDRFDPDPRKQSLLERCDVLFRSRHYLVCDIEAERP
jgi:hypothetical protein